MHEPTRGSTGVRQANAKPTSRSAVRNGVHLQDQYAKRETYYQKFKHESFSFSLLGGLTTRLLLVPVYT